MVFLSGSTEKQATSVLINDVVTVFVVNRIIYSA